MRTKKALQNSFMTIVSYFFLTILGMAAQRVFKDTLGKEYLGISSLFSNIITGLSVVELGFGSAVISNMYKPVAEKDVCKIKSLLRYYKQIYRYIAFVVLIVGIILLPFIDIIVGAVETDIHLKAIFLLYIFDAIMSYLMTYKRSILYANQQMYLVTGIHTIAMGVTYTMQMALLLLQRNFYLYLLISIIFKIVENILINLLADRLYPYIMERKAGKLDPLTKAEIKKKVHGLVFHKFSNFIVNGTDNIIISVIPGLGVVWVAIYSNYALITTKLTQLIDNIFNSVTASVGNLLAEGEKNKLYAVFKQLHLCNTWMYVFVAVSFYYISFPFVRFWMGEEYVLDAGTALIIAIKLFVGGMRASYGTFKSAAGIFYEDRYIPVLESFINLVVSIPLAMLFGLKGILMGTISSSLILYVYSYPKFVYGMVLGKDIYSYLKDLISSVVSFGAAFAFTGICVYLVPKEKVVFNLILTAVMCALIPNFTMFLLNHRRADLHFLKTLLRKMRRGD